jgi:hypothetical protein
MRPARAPPSDLAGRGEKTLASPTRMCSDLCVQAGSRSRNSLLFKPGAPPCYPACRGSAAARGALQRGAGARRAASKRATVEPGYKTPGALAALPSRCFGPHSMATCAGMGSPIGLSLPPVLGCAQQDRLPPVSAVLQSGLGRAGAGSEPAGEPHLDVEPQRLHRCTQT